MTLYRNEVIEKYLAMPLCRELAERANVAAAYWLEGSPHEATEEDGMILAHFARLCVVERNWETPPKPPGLRQVREGDVRTASRILAEHKEQKETINLARLLLLSRSRDALKALLAVPELADVDPEDRSEEAWEAERNASELVTIIEVLR